MLSVICGKRLLLHKLYFRKDYFMYHAVPFSSDYMKKQVFQIGLQ